MHTNERKTEELEERFTNFKVECERIRHRLDTMLEKLDRLDELEAQRFPNKGWFKNLLINKEQY